MLISCWRSAAFYCQIKVRRIQGEILKCQMETWQSGGTKSFFWSDAVRASRFVNLSNTLQQGLCKIPNYLIKRSQIPWLVSSWHFPQELSHPLAFHTHLYTSANNGLMTHVFTLPFMQVYTGCNHQSTHQHKRNTLDISEIFMAEGTMGAYCRLVQHMTAQGGLLPFSFHPGTIHHHCCSVPFQSNVALSLSIFYPRPPAFVLFAFLRFSAAF